MFIFVIMNIGINRYLTLCINYLSEFYKCVINSLRFLKGVFLFKQATLMRYAEGLLHSG